MGIFDRFRAGKKKPQRVGSGMEMRRWRQAPPRRDTRALLEAYAEIPRLGTLIDVVGDGVADVQWCVHERRARNTGKALRDWKLRRGPPDARARHLKALIERGEAVEVPDHPMLTLLDDPNDLMTGRDFAKLLMAHYDLVGEAFVFVEEVAGIPVGLWPLLPDLVLQLPDLTVPKADRKYLVTAGGKVFSIPEDAIVMIKRVNPADPLGRGVGIAHALGDEVDTDEYSARFLKNSFYNNALPGAVIGIENFDGNEESSKVFLESLRQHHGGPDNAGRVMLTSGKTSIARLDTPLKDLQMVELRRFLTDFERMSWRVPPEIIGDTKGSNKATSYAAREHLAEQTTKPRAELLRTVWQKRLMPRFGGEACLGYESPVPADREYTLRVMGTMPEAFSYDEWRGEAGCKPDPNRQGYPLALPGQKPGGQQTPAPEEGGAAEANQEAVHEN